MAVIPLTISGLKEAQADLERLNQEFDKVKNDPIQSKKIAKEFNDLSKAVDDATEELVKMNEAGKLVGTRFDDLNEVLYGTKEEILPLTSQIGEMEDRMYQLAASGKAGSAEFVALQNETSRLRKVIIDTDKSVDLLAENQGFAVFGTGLSQVGERLLRLDFQGAAQDATAMNRAVGNLGKAGTQAISGLTKTVGQLGKTFAMIGKALLTNPIFLIGAAIVALVTIIATLMNKLGLLQPILDTIGEIFGAIKWAIDQVVQALKDFTDWLGITNNAAKKLAEENLEGLTKVIDRTQDVTDSITMRYDEEIKLAQIAGEDTSRLEIEKQEAVNKTDKIKLEAYKRQLKALQVLGTAEQSEIDAINQAIKETEKAIKQGESNIKVIKAQSDADEKKRRNDQIKADRDAYQKRIASQKQFEKDRLMVARQIQDLELELLDDGITKELEQNKIKYDRLIEDLDTNESLLAEERLRLKQLYLEQQFEAEKQIELDYQKALDEALDAANAEREAKKEEERQAELQRKKEQAQRLLDITVEQYKAEADAAQFLQDQKIGIASDTATLLGAVAGKNEAIANVALGIEKAAAIADIIIKTQREIAGYASNPTWSLLPDGGAAIKAAAITGAKIRAGLGIATIAATTLSKFKNGGGGGATGGGGANVGASGGGGFQQAQPDVNLFGQNDFNNLSESQDVETGGQEITVKAVVSETEVTSTQNKIKKLTESASL